MKPFPFPINIRRGAHFGPVVVTCKDSAGEPVDLTGWTAYAEVRPAANRELIVNLAPVITDAEAGNITIELTKTVTKDLLPGAYQWDLLLDRPNGERIGPLMAGAATVHPVMTQPA